MRDSTRSSLTTPLMARVSAAVLLAAGTLAMAGCVSTGLYTEVQMERDLLRAKNEALQSEVDKAKGSSEAIAAEKARLDQELREREEEKNKLQATYDGLLQDLKKELAEGNVEVKQMRDGLRVNVAQDILFDSGSAALDKNGIEVLGKVATQLKKSGHQVLVIGHTDNKPIGVALAKRYPSNWELAGARASSVVRLFSESGLPSKRMQAVSVADVQPVASNKSVEGRAKNRRIEIRLRPIPKED